jgi:hypothetical protein
LNINIPGSLIKNGNCSQSSRAMPPTHSGRIAVDVALAGASAVRLAEGDESVKIEKWI